MTRLFAGLAPGLTIAGLVAGGLVGLLLTVWVVGIRGLLQRSRGAGPLGRRRHRALRAAVEERVATRVLAAETALDAELAARDEAESRTARPTWREIDAELREHAVATRQRPHRLRATGGVRTPFRRGAGTSACRAGTSGPRPNRHRRSWRFLNRSCE